MYLVAGKGFAPTKIGDGGYERKCGYIRSGGESGVVNFVIGVGRIL